MELTSPFNNNLYLLKSQTGQFASVTALNNSGVYLYQLTTGASGVLRALIGNSVAGVTGINSLTGGINLTGAGSVFITQNGQLITISGSASGVVGGGGILGDVVYTSGTQIITGEKTFLNILYISGGGTSELQIVNLNNPSSLTLDTQALFLLNTPNNSYIDLYTTTIANSGGNPVIQWEKLIISGEWQTNANGTNNTTVVNYGRLTGVSGAINTSISNSGSQAWNAANNNSINLSGNLGLTGSNLYVLVTGLSGQANINYATIVNLASTGQQAWMAANNNGINLSGNLATTGSNLYILVTGLSGQANINYATNTNLALTGSNLYNIITGLSGSSNIKFYLASNPQEYAPSGYVTGISGALRSLISASNAGVSSINGLSGILSIIGTGNVTVVNNGQNIIISGTGGGGSVSNPEKRIAIFDPKEYTPPQSNYATLDTLTYLPVLNFDEVIEQSAIWSDIIPKTATLSNGLEAKILWTGDSTSGSVRWKFAVGRGLATGFAAPSGVTSNIINSNGVSPFAYITLTGLDSLATGDFYRLQVSRDVADGADTLTGYAKLVKVELSYI